MQNMIAVVGLGNLGAAAAERLQSQGPMLLIDPDPAARALWTSSPGVSVAAGIDTACWGSVTRVHVLVRTNEQAVSVLQGLNHQVNEGIPVHVHTTLAPATAGALGAISLARIRVLEQPITGGAAGIRAGRATVLSAGLADGRDLEWIGHLASHVITFEEFGQPALAKLVNNTIAAVTTRITTELLATAVDQGLPLDAMRAALRHGSGGSRMAEGLDELGVDQARLLAKDVRLLQDVIGELPCIRLDDEPSMLAGLASFHGVLADHSKRHCQHPASI